MDKINKLLDEIVLSAREIQFNTKVFSASGPRVRAALSIREDAAEIQMIMDEAAAPTKLVKLAAPPKPVAPVESQKPAAPKPIARKTQDFTGANAIPTRRHTKSEASTKRTFKF